MTIKEQWEELLGCAAEEMNEAHLVAYRDWFLAGAVSALYSIWPKAVAAGTADEIREALMQARLECSTIAATPRPLPEH